MDTKAILLEYVRKELLADSRMEPGVSDDLLSEGLIDSMGVVKLVLFIEERFGIQIPDGDIVFENFQTIEALAGYLERQENQGQTADRAVAR